MRDGGLRLTLIGAAAMLLLGAVYLWAVRGPAILMDLGNIWCA